MSERLNQAGSDTPPSTPILPDIPLPRQAGSIDAPKSPAPPPPPPPAPPPPPKPAPSPAPPPPATQELPNNTFAKQHLKVIAPNVFQLTEAGQQILRPKREIVPSPAGNPPSGHPFDIIEHTYRVLNDWLVHVSRTSEFAVQIRWLVHCIDNLVEDTPEGALAATMLVPMVSYTAAHSIQVAVLLARLAPTLKLTREQRRLLLGAALTMNIGSAALQNVLNDQAAPLTSEQKEHIQLHPLLSSALLREAGVTDELWHRLICEHHETPEGTGYPMGSTQQHPLSMALRVADVLGARLCGRSYRKKLLSRTAWRTLYNPDENSNEEGKMVQAFVKSIGMYPAGTFVRLQNDMVCMVVGQTEDPQHPVVVAFARNGSFVPIDTTAPEKNIKEPADFSIPDHALTHISRAWNLD